MYLPDVARSCCPHYTIRHADLFRVAEILLTSLKAAGS
jgi:hypothetical protein